MKKIVAIPPYIYQNTNFKMAPYEAWVKCEGQVANAHYPWRLFHGLVFRWELPSFWKKKKEARLRFVQPISLKFDTFPDYAFYEIIPLFWDVWPPYFEKTCLWLEKHHVKTAIFTSLQTADRIQKRFPQMNVIHITEGIDVNNYNEGRNLRDRTIDFFEYGRNIDSVVKYNFDNLNVIRGQKNGKNLLTQEELKANLQNAKIVAAYPKSWTNPDQAGDIETLTQRYWEGMLSRCVMIGHAPKELINLIGYNPVVEVDLQNPDDQLRSVVVNIEKYQGLVDRNRETALNKCDWSIRMKTIQEWLCSLGYNV